MPGSWLHPSQVAEFGFALALAKERISKQCYLLLKDADFMISDFKRFLRVPSIHSFEIF